MSARRSGPPPGGAPEALWSLLVIAAALVGGLAAAEIVHTSVTVTLIVSVVAAAIAIVALVRWRGSGEELSGGEHRRTELGGREPAPAPGPGPRPGPGQPELDGPGRGEADAKTVVQLLPAQPQQAGGPDWWQRTQAGPPPPSPGARRAPAPDLSSYLSATQIAQCPNCGAFGLEIGRIRGGWGFRCDSCAHTWAWRPGTPWPPIRVAPRRRTQSRPPS